MEQLILYEDFLSFVKTIASSSMCSTWSAPKALTAGTNLVAPVSGGCVAFGQAPDSPASPWSKWREGLEDYSYDECVAWVSTPEGEKYVNETDITDPTMVQAIFAVAKGKGAKGNKGGGKFNGKPKGGAAPGKGGEFQGACHKCGAWGHRINACPLWDNKQGANKKGPKGGGKGGKSGVHLTGEEHAFHFMLTENIFDHMKDDGWEPVCGGCKMWSEAAPQTHEIPGAKWFNTECGNEVDGDQFPIISTATETGPAKAKMGPMTKTSQKEMRQIASANRAKADAHWFSNTSISDLKNLGEIQYTAQLDGVTDDEVREYESPDSPPETQSFMSFMNSKISEAVGNEEFCGLFTDVPPDAPVLTVSEKDLVWTCVAVAVDTGSCANVTPPGVFGLEVTPSEASKSKKPFFGADKSPIINMGNQTVAAVCEEGHNWGTTFAVADKLSRPLASGFEITQAGNELSVWKGGGHIKCKKTGAKTALRQEGKLWFLDLWVQVPKSIGSSAFVRPS